MSVFDELDKKKEIFLNNEENYVLGAFSIGSLRIIIIEGQNGVECKNFDEVYFQMNPEAETKKQDSILLDNAFSSYWWSSSNNHFLNYAKSKVKEEIKKGNLKTKDDIFFYFMHIENYTKNADNFLNNINLMYYRKTIVEALKEILEYYYSVNANDVIDFLTVKKNDSDLCFDIDNEIDQYILQDESLKSNHIKLRTISNFSNLPNANSRGINPSDLNGVYSQEDIIKLKLNGYDFTNHSYDYGDVYHCDILFQTEPITEKNNVDVIHAKKR